MTDTTTRSVAAPTCTQPVRLRIYRLTGTVAKRHVNPKIRPVSAIMEPTPFPSARPGSPIHAAMTETTASGVVVPRETIVAPMTILGMPVLRESWTTPSIIQSAPFERTRIHTTMTASKTSKGRLATRFRNTVSSPMNRKTACTIVSPPPVQHVQRHLRFDRTLQFLQTTIQEICHRH